jgi:hypothetical protein
MGFELIIAFTGHLDTQLVTKFYRTLLYKHITTLNHGIHQFSSNGFQHLCLKVMRFESQRQPPAGQSITWSDRHAPTIT